MQLKNKVKIKLVKRVDKFLWIDIQQLLHKYKEENNKIQLYNHCLYQRKKK